MIDNDKKVLINELRTYNYLLKKLFDMTEQHARTIHHIEDCIARVDDELNDFHIPAIKYDNVSISQIKPTANSRVVELITEQETLNKRLSDILLLQKTEVDKLVYRIDEVDICLLKLTNWEKDFITHLYIESKCIEYMLDTYRYKSRTSVYNNSDRLLAKMLKK